MTEKASAGKHCGDMAGDGEVSSAAPALIQDPSLFSITSLPICWNRALASQRQTPPRGLHVTHHIVNFAVGAVLAVVASAPAFAQ